jgi:hypothetical protein
MRVLSRQCAWAAAWALSAAAQVWERAPRPLCALPLHQALSPCCPCTHPHFWHAVCTFAGCRLFAAHRAAESARARRTRPVMPDTTVAGVGCAHVRRWHDRGRKTGGAGGAFDPDVSRLEIGAQGDQHCVRLSRAGQVRARATPADRHVGCLSGDRGMAASTDTAAQTQNTYRRLGRGSRHVCCSRWHRSA